MPLLYFWSRECGHCRETPKLKALYDEYGDTGSSSDYAILRELELDNWNTFIEKYDLDWINGFESDSQQTKLSMVLPFPSTPKKLILDAR